MSACNCHGRAMSPSCCLPLEKPPQRDHPHSSCYLPQLPSHCFHRSESSHRGRLPILLLHDITHGGRNRRGYRSYPGAFRKRKMGSDHLSDKDAAAKTDIKNPAKRKQTSEEKMRARALSRSTVDTLPIQRDETSYDAHQGDKSNLHSVNVTSTCNKRWHRDTRDRLIMPSLT